MILDNHIHNMLMVIAIKTLFLEGIGWNPRGFFMSWAGIKEDSLCHRVESKKVIYAIGWSQT
jgi:hypothetical protein